MTVVTADKLRRMGVNVDVQAMDWSTLVSRRPIKDAPTKDARGWHIFHTTWPGLAMQNPITNTAIASPCDGKNWFGWSCDERARYLLRAPGVTPAWTASRLIELCDGES